MHTALLTATIDSYWFLKCSQVSQQAITVTSRSSALRNLCDNKVDFAEQFSSRPKVVGHRSASNQIMFPDIYRIAWMLLLRITRCSHSTEPFPERNFRCSPFVSQSSDKAWGSLAEAYLGFARVFQGDTISQKKTVEIKFLCAGFIGNFIQGLLFNPKHAVVSAFRPKDSF